MGKRKILVIEDSSIMQELFVSALKSLYDLEVAGEGRQGLELARNSPDLILLDVMLPDITGHEVCTLLKADELTASIPVIFLSAKTGTISRTMAYQLGAINYLEKPFEIAELKSLINSILKSGKTGGPLIEFKQLSLSTDSFQASFDNIPLELTKSEFLILLALCKHPETVLTREQLLIKLDPLNENESDRMIDNHISSLRKKLKSQTNISIKTIYGIGYQIE